jgi:hypothetical protein
MTEAGRHPSLRAALQANDRGTALMTVMATTMILFVLATTLMMMVGYQTQSTALRTKRVRATHVADAGINAYLYQLKNQYGYWSQVPDTGWVGIGDGERYRVKVTPASGSTPLTMYSTGTADDGTVTIAATIRYPSFADYMFLSNQDINIGSAATINGQVRCNQDINNAGHITGKVTAAGVVTNTGRMDLGFTQHQAAVDFNQVLAAMDDIMLSAKGNNAYFASSGAYGYRVTLNGQTVTIEKITGGITTGNLTTVAVKSMAVPPSGALYFSDNVWVSGTYSTPVTICSDHDIYVPNNFVPSNLNSVNTAGLIAKGNIIVPCWYASVPQAMTLTAAMLSQSGRIYADTKQGVFRTSIVITGSETYYDANGGFVTIDQYGNSIAGFLNRTYTYDQRLDDFPPPKYPVIQDGSLKINTWIEDRNPVL